MNLNSVLLTLLCVVGIGVGQILFKLSASASAANDQSILGFLNGWLVAALVLYGAATLLWIYVLRVVPLALAYPLFALAFVLVPVLAHYVFDEPLRMSSLVGGVLIVAGVAISTRGAL